MERRTDIGDRGQWRRTSAILSEECASPAVCGPTAIPALLRIPVEIWSKIFHSTITVEFVRISTSALPLLLSHVCSYWRQVTLRTPELWSTLSLKGSAGKLEQQTPLALLWLSRSGSLPLFLEVVCTGSRRALPPVRLCQALLPYSDRWQCLKVDLLLACAKILLSNPDVSFSSLQSVKVNVQTVLWEYNDFTISPSSTRLQILSISSASLDPWIISCPLLCLTHLFISTSVTAPAIEEALQTLSHCPSLQFLRISINDAASSAGAEHTNRVHLPDLHTLYINADTDFGRFLDGLVLPSLTKCLINMWTPPNASSLLSLVSRSACKLKTLCCHEPPLSEDDLLHLVEEIPSLVDLRATRYDKLKSSRVDLVTPAIVSLLSARNVARV